MGLDLSYKEWGMSVAVQTMEIKSLIPRNDPEGNQDEFVQIAVTLMSAVATNVCWHNNKKQDNLHNFVKILSQAVTVSIIAQKEDC